MLSQELMKSFDFDEADLAANKIGQLTEKQKARLNNEYEEWNKQRLIVSLCVLGFTWGLAFALPLLTFSFCPFRDNCQADWMDVQTSMIMLIIIDLLWVALLGGAGIAFTRMVFSKSAYKLKTVEGPIDLVKLKALEELAEYELKVGDQVFNVDSSLADFMQQGEVYAFYYLADAKNEDEPMQVLSAEKV